MGILRKWYDKLLQRVGCVSEYANQKDFIKSGRIRFEGQFGDTVTLVHCDQCGYDYDIVLDWCPLCGAAEEKEF